jgi:hypothetical protein
VFNIGDFVFNIGDFEFNIGDFEFIFGDFVFNFDDFVFTSGGVPLAISSSKSAFFYSILYTLKPQKTLPPSQMAKWSVCKRIRMEVF